MNRFTSRAAVCGLAVLASTFATSVASAPVAGIRPAPAINSPGSDGKTHTLESLTKDQALLLYFIKDGCPVNDRMQPMFNQIANDYKDGKKVKIMGVYNMSASNFTSWKRQTKTPFDALIDPEKKVIKSYKALSSPWVVLVQNGEITHEWKGFGRDALIDMNKTIGRLNGIAPKDHKFEGAPASLAKG